MSKKQKQIDELKRENEELKRRVERLELFQLVDAYRYVPYVPIQYVPYPVPYSVPTPTYPIITISEGSSWEVPEGSRTPIYGDTSIVSTEWAMD